MPTSRKARAPRCTSAPRPRPADMDRGECRSTPAGIAGARTPPVERLRRILPAARSSSLLCDRCRARSRRLLVNARVAVNVRFKFHIGLADGLRVAQKQIAARLQVFVKTLHQLCLPLFRKINKDVHAKDAVELS